MKKVNKVSSSKEIKISDHSRAADVFEILKRDHRKIERLFEVLLDSESDDRELREREFSSLKAILEVHTQAEERFFYPKTKKSEPLKLLTLEAYEEHAIAKSLLDDLDKLDTDDDVWTAKLKVLSEAVKHHVKEEETSLFPKTKKLLSKSQAKEIGEQIVEFEDQWEGSGKSLLKPFKRA